MANIMHEQTPDRYSPPFASQPSKSPGDHERLFRLLEEDGPAPEEFMLYLSDPMLETENIFEDFEDES